MVIAMIILSPQVAFEGYETLPDEPSFTSKATISVEDASIAEVEFEKVEEGRIHINAYKYGETVIAATDEGKSYIYTISIYDDNGVDRAKITLTEDFVT